MLLALLLALAVPASGPTPEASGTPAASLRVPTAPGEALIVNSGSTNHAGYRLRVYATGWTVLQGDVPVKKLVDAALVKQFFADLKAAGPVDQIGTMHCFKSTSFGSATQVAYRGKTSPDLSCPATTDAGRALATDLGLLADAASVSALPRAPRPVSSP